MPFHSINGISLFYETVGRGHPCFVLHGGLGLDHTYFRPWLDPLAAQFQLIYLDLRGNGQSERSSPDGTTFAQFCDDLETLCVALECEQIAVLGHSFGGFIALQFAHLYPSRVSHLILVDTVAVLDFDDDIAAHLDSVNPGPSIRIALETGPTSDDDLAQIMQTIAPLYFYHYDAQLAQTVFQHTHWSHMANQRGFELLQEYDMQPYLASMTIPTLCISGKDDWLARPAQVERLASGLPMATLVQFEQCGHFPFIEQTASFLASVRNWLHNKRGTE